MPPLQALSGRGKLKPPSPLIFGVTLTRLSDGTDKRGQLNELLSMRNAVEPIVHVYQVHAAAKSVRAWLLHKLQDDRLAFTMGYFRVVLFDLRTDSPTYLQLDVLDLGEERQALLRIPAFVVHGVQNMGTHLSSFVNLPTRVYDPENPTSGASPQIIPASRIILTLPDRPFITVVLSTWNRGRHIIPTLELALQQSFSDFEVLIVGDGCDDDTGNICSPISASA